MALNIKNPEVERLANEIAKVTAQEGSRGYAGIRSARRMILDSSALIAVVLREPGFENIVQRIADAGTLAIGAPTPTKTGIVLGNRIGEEHEACLSNFFTNEP